MYGTWWEERREKGELYGESNMETYITICKQIANGNLLYVSGTQTGALCQAEGWDAEGDGKEIQEGGNMGVPMADSCCMTESHKIL